MERIIRNFLEIRYLDEMIQAKKPNSKFTVGKVFVNDFQLNKFFINKLVKAISGTID